MRPKTCKEWRGKRVILTKELRTIGGLIFHAGETVIVRNAKKDGTFELYRRAAAISGALEGCFLLDEEQKPFSIHDVTANAQARGAERSEASSSADVLCPGD